MLDVTVSIFTKCRKINITIEENASHPVGSGILSPTELANLFDGALVMISIRVKAWVHQQWRTCC